MSGGARKQLRPRAAILVASGVQYMDIASQLGVNERTIRRWVADDGFANDVRVVQARVVREAAVKLSDGMLAASRVLVSLLDHEDARVRLSAARSVFAIAPELRDQQITEERLAMLEHSATSLAGGQEAQR